MPRVGHGTGRAVATRGRVTTLALARFAGARRPRSEVWASREWARTDCGPKGKGSATSLIAGVAPAVKILEVVTHVDTRARPKATKRDRAKDAHPRMRHEKREPRVSGAG